MPVKLRILRAAPPFSELRELAHTAAPEDAATRQSVAEILREVREHGDEAVLEYTRRWDRLDVDRAEELRIGNEEMDRASESVDADVLAALRRAAEKVRRFHERQREHGFIELFPDGSLLGQRITPLRRVGIYVPGGRAAYPSSVLMNAIPAAVAGVAEIAMVTPAPEGKIEPAVLAAARIAGVTEAFRIGGAQAVAALAYGTDTISPVDKIVGPGNRWVAEAKRQAYGWVDIDMIAGPSEILIIADGDAEPLHVAADLIGQAEHDPDAVAWLVTPSEELAHALPEALDQLLTDNPRREIARTALERNGLVVLVDDLPAAAAVADLRAPEHLELLVPDPLALAGRIRNAGAIFLGATSPEPVGDYYAGPNHVLPTGGTARWASPLGVYDFLKRTSLIGYSAERLREHAPDVIRLAEAEGLHGHAAAVRLRLGEAR